MHRSRIVAGICTAVSAALPLRPGAAEPYAVVFEHNVPVKMRDGVTLSADIYRPKADGRFPVLLQRTPYNKDGDHGFGLKAAARGYVVVVQDVRGRYASEGEWYTFKHESNDGYDTVEWAAALPYADGKGRHVRRLLRRRDTDAHRDRPSSASRRHLPRRDGQQLPRELDVSGRRVPAVVQPVVDVGPRAGHVRAPDRRTQQRDEGRVAAPARARTRCSTRRPTGRRRMPRQRWRRTISTGSRIRARTPTGNSGRSRPISATSPCPC